MGKTAALSEIPPRVTEWQRFRRVFFARGVVVFGLVVLVLLLLVAIFAEWLAPYNPYQQEMGNALQPISASISWAPTSLDEIR